MNRDLQQWHRYGYSLLRILSLLRIQWSTISASIVDFEFVHCALIYSAPKIIGATLGQL